MIDLDDIELDCEDERVITLPSTTVLALVAECRELRRLKSAMARVKSATELAICQARSLNLPEGGD